MKRQRSSSTSGPQAKKARFQRQDATVTAAVRKELRKKTDWKYADQATPGAGANVTSSGTITSLFGNLIRGDAGLNNFSGNDIRPQAITLKYYCWSNQSHNTVRFVVFQWFDAATPAPSGILEGTGTGLGVISPILVTNKKYIKVLYDKTHMLAPTASDSTFTNIGNGTIDPVTIYIPGKRLRPVRYNSTNNTVQDGQIYVLAISDDSAISYPVVVWYSRVTFSDS